MRSSKHQFGGRRCQRERRLNRIFAASAGTAIAPRGCGLLALSMLLGLALAAGANNDLPGAYRGPPYRAPTPPSAPGATTLFFTDDVQRLIAASDVLLINVAPITLAPPDAEGRRQWIQRPNLPIAQIPGSIWLPNVGYQALDPAMTAYFRDNLQRYTAGDKSRPLLFYCTADCWMSWNSVKRAIEAFDYRNVYWYPYGIDGWKEDGLGLEAAVPEPFPAAAAPAS